MKRMWGLGVMFLISACKKEPTPAELDEAYQKAFETAAAKEEALYKRFKDMRAKLTDTVPACSGPVTANGFLRISSFKIKALTGETSRWVDGESDPAPNQPREQWDSPPIMILPSLHPKLFAGPGRPNPTPAMIDAVGPDTAAAAATVKSAPGFLIQTVDKYIPIQQNTAPGTAGTYSGGEVSGKIFVVESSNGNDTPRCAYAYEVQAPLSLKVHGSISQSLHVQFSNEVGKVVQAKLAGQ